MQSKMNLDPFLEEQLPGSEHPDQGFFGPQSVVWRLNRERINYLGGLRAILLQLAHPKIAQGVADHSGFHQDPLGRFARTMGVVQDILFEDQMTARRAAQRVYRRHRNVRGTWDGPQGPTPYRGNDPGLLMWVYATLIDSLMHIQRLLLPPLARSEWELFYRQGRAFAHLFGIPSRTLPPELADFDDYFKGQQESLTVTPTGRAMAAKLLRSPHPVFQPLNTFLASATLDPGLRRAYGLAWSPANEKLFTSACGMMRRAVDLAPAGLRYSAAARKREKRLKEMKKENSMNWLIYFQSNRSQRAQIDWDMGIDPEPGLRAPLIRSLQKFQVGESGEGNHLKAGARKTGDPDYLRAIELFIAEEQDHASMLKQIILALDGGLLESHWSDQAFIAIRRLMGLKMELMVLLIAELIAKRYYRALDEGTQDPVLRAVFGQIRRDEEGHIAFHLDTLNRTFGGWPWWTRALVYSTWQWMFRIVSALVALDHRHVLQAVHASRLAFWKDCQVIFENAAWYAFQPRPDPVNKLFIPTA